ncbi:hypothetical protein FUA26_12510 [Seonamhaeicola algicola]|uniref:Fibronectin type-III domain-containing protein n=1 Tax=Seonamhaeicola algicola TaxID=1719036 RepID=A0A5C7AF56_9FLAO|nr:hypothetical protein [Seonamhaeicola algicola]TXE07041.1 hypothetical protein FUA26_12510 [Seonamhaeicola algicola]
MKLNKYIQSGILIIGLILFSCGGGSDDGDGGPSGGGILPPESTVLEFPLKDEACYEGTVISETESRITFEWSISANTNNYTVVLKNLGTDETSEHDTANNSISITVKRNTAYSWYVVSKSNKTTTTATSETWKFYNAGEGVENYAPFPAEVVAPAMGSEVAAPVTLSWTGSDADNDIASYDVYLGTNNPPTTLQETTTNTSIENIALTANTVYYWKVITTDYSGSSSESQVFEFRTE